MPPNLGGEVVEVGGEGADEERQRQRPRQRGALLHRAHRRVEDRLHARRQYLHLEWRMEIEVTSLGPALEDTHSSQMRSCRRF